MSPQIKVIVLLDINMLEHYDEIFTSPEKAVKYLQAWEDLHLEMNGNNGRYYLTDDKEYIRYDSPIFGDEEVYMVLERNLDPKPEDFIT